MKTIVLPGFSDTNRQWTQEAKSILEKAGHNTLIHEWKHWKTQDNRDWNPNQEAKSIIYNYLSGDHTNILAKSLGTLVAVKVISKIPKQINKVLLCGIPLYDLDDLEKKEYLTLNHKENLQVIQNKNDNHGTYLESEEFLSKIDPKIPLVQKDRPDHSYPYYEDFAEFFED